MKRVSNYKKFLEEAELNLPELGKLRKGSFRGDVLVNKLKGHDPLTTNNNKSVEITGMKDEDGNWVAPEDAVDNITNDDGQYDIDKAKSYLTKGTRYVPVFKDEDGDEFRLNQFKKTKDFGSSGAGRLIRQFESVQCIFLAIKQSYPSTTILNPYNLNRFFREFQNSPDKMKMVHLPESIEINSDLINDFLQDKNWVASFCKIPNKLWSIRQGILNNTGLKYQVYHVGYNKSDSPYITIYNKYKSFAKEGGYKDINIAKYCPADVYLVSTNHNTEVINAINNTTNIIQLTSVIDRYFDSKILIPLSLKKISKDDPFKITVNKEEGKELPDFSIKSFIVGSDSKGIGSKISTSSVWKHKNDKNVDVKDRRINFDSSDTSKRQNVDGEVEGSSSRHGKASFTAIKRIIDEYSDKITQNLQSHEELRKLTIEELQNEIISMTEKVKEQDPDSSMIVVTPIKRGSDTDGNENKLISRLQSLQIVLALLQLYFINSEVADLVITKIMRYALSIQNDKFDTPRYLRVI